jgi:hypothetical protein
MKKSCSLSAFAMLLLLIFGAEDVQGQLYCDPDDIDGLISCGDTLELRSPIEGHYDFAFTFDAEEGDAVAFIGEAPLYPNASTKIWIASGDCTIKFAEDPPELAAIAEICPFFVPQSGTYVLRIWVYGLRGPLYIVRMVCFKPHKVDCGNVSSDEWTWGRIKALYD